MIAHRRLSSGKAAKIGVLIHHSLAKVAKLWCQEQVQRDRKGVVGPAGLEPATNRL